MYFEPKGILLKDGRTAAFRSPAPSDAPELLRYLDATARETPFLLRSPGENTLTIEQEERFLESCLASETEYMILCTIDGQIAGNCQIVRKKKWKNMHRASIGIALRKEYWSLGIGTAMFRELIAIGESWSLMQLELEVIEGNTRAMALYEKMGFETVGFTPNAIQMPDGSFAKEYLMVRPLCPVLKRLEKKSKIGG